MCHTVYVCVCAAVAMEGQSLSMKVVNSGSCINVQGSSSCSSSSSSVMCAKPWCTLTGRYRCCQLFDLTF